MFSTNTLKIHWKIHWKYIENTLKIHWKYMAILPVYIEHMVKMILKSLRTDFTQRIDWCILSQNLADGEDYAILLVCIPGRIQHLLGAVPIDLSRHFAHEHDKAITTAVAYALDLGLTHKTWQTLNAAKIIKPWIRTSQHGG